MADWSRWRRPRYRRLYEELKNLVPLKVYCERNNLSPTAVRYQIATNKLIAWKSNGRWFVKVED